MDTTGIILGVIGATLPGVLIALLGNQLQVQRENSRMSQANTSGRTLIALEIDGNRGALAEYWKTINALDTDQAPQKTREAHLAGMAAGGLIGQVVPHWSFVRWEGILPGTLAVLSPTEVTAIDKITRDLHAITDLHTQLITLSPQEMAQLEKDRFWTNRYAGFRLSTFERLEAAVGRVLQAPHPLNP
jgi:hypothetical protein